MKSVKALIVGILAVTLLSCDDGPPPALTFRQRELADTLYMERVAVLRPQLDSLCNARFDSLVWVAVDSLVKVRREEEARLRARIQQQQ